MAVNTFIPTTSSRAPTYVLSPKTTVDAQGRQQAVSGYEWLDYGTFVPGTGMRWRTNPPFASWEAGGHGMPFQKAPSGGGKQSPVNVKRGYIRRAQVNATDLPSTCRLYFMYNPTTITRQYVNYLDQGALDPFNTIFESGNLVAPPSILEFSFELFFDRQTEAMVPGNRGVLDDMDYFDLVVRNVIPGGPNGNNALPDNGLMMVNPRDITVVFSKDISVQGRPVNSQIVYEKFTHEMTPTRMRIALTMRVIYMGPVRDITAFSTETVNVDRAIPYDILPTPKFEFEFNELEWPSNYEDAQKPNLETSGKGDTLAHLSGDSAGGDAATLAKYESDKADTEYVGASGPRNNLWAQADCSSFVWGGFAALPDGDAICSNLGWPKFADGKRSGNIPSVQAMMDPLGNSEYVERILGFNMDGKGDLDGDSVFKKVREKGVKGDLLLRYKHPERDSNHVAFLWETTDDSFTVLHAASEPQDVLLTTYSTNSIQYNYMARVFRATSGHFQDDETDNDPTEDD